jgi:hypothetical protein
MKAMGIALACSLMLVTVGSSAQDTTSSGKSKSADRRLQAVWPRATVQRSSY